MEDIFLKVVSVLILGAMLFAAGLIKKMPSMIAKEVEQNRKYDHDKALQIDNFYRSAGNTVMQDILSEWTKIMSDLNYINVIIENDGMNELVRKTMLYGSADSLEIVSRYMQYAFSDQVEDGYVYIAMIVSALKKDFTGEDVDPLVLIQIKINDYSDNEAFYKETLSRIKSTL